MGSTSGTLAALMRVWSFSDCCVTCQYCFQILQESAPDVERCDRGWVSRAPRVCTYGDLDTVIGQDEGGVGGCELGGRHCEVCFGGCLFD